MFRGSEAALRWEPLVAVGIPPSPRFGHQMVVLFDEKGVEGEYPCNIASLLSGVALTPTLLAWQPTTIRTAGSS